MEATSLTLEITSVITLIFSIAGGLKLWYEMKQKMALIKQELDYLKSECMSVKNEFTDLETKVEENKEKVGTMYLETKQEIHDLNILVEKTKNEILTAISNIK